MVIVRRQPRTYASKVIKDNDRVMQIERKEEREHKLYVRGEKWLSDHSEVVLQEAEVEEHNRKLFILLMENGIFRAIS